MTFIAQPEIFFSLLAVTVVLGLFSMSFWEIRKTRKIERELALSYPGIVKNVLAKAVLLFSVAMLLAVLLGESYFWSKTQEEEIRGRLLFVFDNTKSMRAGDPAEASRLERSKEIAVRVLGDIRSADVGVCAFGATANCLVPISELTHDKRILGVVIEDFIVSGDSYGRGSAVVGSLEDIASAIEEQYPDSENAPMVIVFTDGEQTVNSDSSKDIAYLRKSGIKFVLVGVGEKEGAKIPIFSEPNGKGRFLNIYETFRGEHYVSFLEEDYLRDLARKIQGEYFFENDRGNLAEFVKANLPRSSRFDQSERVTRENIQHFSFLGLIIVLFVVFTRKYIL